MENRRLSASYVGPEVIHSGIALVEYGGHGHKRFGLPVVVAAMALDIHPANFPRLDGSLSRETPQSPHLRLAHLLVKRGGPEVAGVGGRVSREKQGWRDWAGQAVNAWR